MKEACEIKITKRELNLTTTYALDAVPYEETVQRFIKTLSTWFNTPETTIYSDAALKLSVDAYLIPALQSGNCNRNTVYRDIANTL